MITTEILSKAWTLMCTAKAMAETYENNRQDCIYVHSTSRGHESIQFATAFQLRPFDYVSPYYRDDSMLLGLGFTPLELMLQLLAKKNDIFSGGRTYYAHPNCRPNDKPTIIHQSSATGMQAIPATGIAQGLRYLEKINSPLLRKGLHGELPVVICSLGDASIAEGEVSEAFQFAVLKQLPVVYLIQDNDWGISASANEARAMDSYDYAGGFPGLNRVRVNGSDFVESYHAMQQVVAYVRAERLPCLVQAKVPLLGHHTSGIRKEAYRSAADLQKHSASDPVHKLKDALLQSGFTDDQVQTIEKDTRKKVHEQFLEALASPEPNAADVEEYVFVPTPVTAEAGERAPVGAEKINMVDATLIAIREIMDDHPEAILYGQDVGKQLGGVFRETATLANWFGDHRVFNTAIQEAYIIGSTAGLAAVGVKPIAEIQFADYIYPGINQLVTELSKSCYLSCGKFPVQALIRVPIGAYGGGGPYHSGSIETTLLSIKGIKVVYPSNAADMKGLMKAAFLDPNPVIMLEHKALYWSKMPGTGEAKTAEPSKDYIIPLGKGAIALNASGSKMKAGDTCCIITYGMGIYWAKAAASQFPGQVEIIDLRSLFPIDDELVYTRVKQHGKCIVLTEDTQNNSFAEALAARISRHCFQWLDMAVEVMGSLNLPAVPLNVVLEQAMMPNPTKVANIIGRMLKS